MIRQNLNLSKNNTLQNQVNNAQHQKQNQKVQQQNFVDDFQLLPDLDQNSHKIVGLQKKNVSINEQFKQQLMLNSNVRETKPEKQVLNCLKFDFKVLEEQQINFQQVKERLEKFINFINFHEIKYKDIWNQTPNSSLKSRQLSFSLYQFSTKVYENVGYYLNNNELSAVMKLLSIKNVVRPSDFAKLGLWKNDLQKKYDPFNKNGSTLMKVKSSSQIRSNNCSRITKQKSKQINQQRSNLKNGLSFASQKQNNENYSVEMMKSQQKLIMKSQIELNNILNNSSTPNNLKKSSAKLYSLAKSKQKIQSLKNDIKSNVLQKKWDFVVMVGEMNQWLQKMNEESKHINLNVSNVSTISKEQEEDAYPMKYKIYNNPEDGTFKISQFDTTLKIQQEIPEVVFIKKYESLKKKMKAQINNKSNLKGTVLMVLQQGDKLTKNTLAGRLDQRDQQLNYVLLQIMRMKSIFTHQLKILKENHINI